MLFNSLEYLLFLPTVFILYWLLNDRYKAQNILILAASYVFYGWWNWHLLYLITLSSFVAYAGGLLLDTGKGQRSESLRRTICAVTVILNMGVLGVFKYYNFFVESLTALFPSLSEGGFIPLIHVILPVGISFYTLQSVAYVIDVYRGQVRATKDPVAFFSFISFFPQLVAGPIERATNLLPQFLKPRRFDYNTAVDGCRRILWGLFKKVVIADNCAVYVNEVWADYNAQGSATLALAAVLFAFQIYGDFSGYSDIAIGSARLLGIRIMDNFRMPFLSRNMAELWRRWHISLNTWFRDYVYIPLGGSREGRWKHIRNIFIVFLLSGLWHGANWTFVAWGLFLALCFVPRVLLGKGKDARDFKDNRTLQDWGGTLMTFVLFVISFIFFRAPDIGSALQYICHTLSFASPRLYYPGRMLTPTLCAILFMMVMEWLQRSRAHSLDFEGRCPAVVRLAVYYLLMAMIVLFSGQAQTFIYFQF